ncbi:uncharacterized protein [Watersipora subatra]|uniref:uncharacterized protein n=1 Tax=Watersipora subatra TaxID=2589382 RepID=UPI00355C3676
MADERNIETIPIILPPTETHILNIVSTSSIRTKQKQTVEEKVKLIGEVEEGGKAIDICRREKIPRSTLATWIKEKNKLKDAYRRGVHGKVHVRSLGNEVVIPKRRPISSKIKIIKEIENGASIMDVCRRRKLSKSTIHGWLQNKEKLRKEHERLLFTSQTNGCNPSLSSDGRVVTVEATSQQTEQALIADDAFNILQGLLQEEYEYSDGKKNKGASKPVATNQKLLLSSQGSANQPMSERNLVQEEGFESDDEKHNGRSVVKVELRGSDSEEDNAAAGGGLVSRSAESKENKLQHQGTHTNLHKKKNKEASSKLDDYTPTVSEERVVRECSAPPNIVRPISRDSGIFNYAHLGRIVTRLLPAEHQAELMPDGRYIMTAAAIGYLAQKLGH